MITPFVAGRWGPLQAEVLHALTRAGFDVSDSASMELDLTDGRACRRAVARARADIVIDCSGADDERRERSLQALDRMLIGAENVALAAADAGAHSVYVSDVTVFGDASIGSRVESDPVTPTSRLGGTTVEAEQTVMRLNEEHTILRSSALYGPQWASEWEGLIDRASVTERLLVEPRTMCAPTYAPHLANVLVSLVRRPCYGIVHRAATGECNELELTRAVVRLVGTHCRVEPPLAQTQPAAKPAHPVRLASRREDLPAIPHWRIGLRVWALERQTANQQPDHAREARPHAGTHGPRQQPTPAGSRSDSGGPQEPGA